MELSPPAGLRAAAAREAKRSALAQRTNDRNGGVGCPGAEGVSA